MKKKVINFLDTQKQKAKVFSLPIIMLFISTTAQASCSKLAKAAGIQPVKLEMIINKLVRIESTTGNYNVMNHRSGAYGRYQIMPSTAKFYAKKLGIPQNLWKKPYNQDKIFNAIMQDNIKSLKRNGHKISAFSIYAIHQQGARGFNTIMKNKPISKLIERNMRENLPKKYHNIPKAYLRYVWIKCWKNKLG